jgi:predicted RND superfamily exporter protein
LIIIITLAKLIERDQKVTQLVSTVLVFLATVITFRSLLAAIIPILIVTVANIWLQGWMGYFDIPLSTLAAGVAALVIGIGIDYSIHFMSRFKYERRKLKSIKKAVEEATKNTGVSLTITALATIGAFLAFNIGKMPEMGKFGNLMALGIFFSLILTLSLLPILLIWEERLIYWLLSRIRIGIEHEFRFALVKEAIDIEEKLPICSIEEKEKLEKRLKEIKAQVNIEELKKLYK